MTTPGETKRYDMESEKKKKESISGYPTERKKKNSSPSRIHTSHINHVP